MRCRMLRVARVSASRTPPSRPCNRSPARRPSSRSVRASLCDVQVGFTRVRTEPRCRDREVGRSALMPWSRACRRRGVSRCLTWTDGMAAVGSSPVIVPAFRLRSARRCFPATARSRLRFRPLAVAFAVAVGERLRASLVKADGGRAAGLRAAGRVLGGGTCPSSCRIGCRMPVGACIGRRGMALRAPRTRLCTYCHTRPCRTWGVWGPDSGRPGSCHGHGHPAMPGAGRHCFTFVAIASGLVWAGGQPAGTGRPCSGPPPAACGHCVGRAMLWTAWPVRMRLSSSPKTTSMTWWWAFSYPEGTARVFARPASGVRFWGAGWDEEADVGRARVPQHRSHSTRTKLAGSHHSRSGSTWAGWAAACDAAAALPDRVRVVVGDSRRRARSLPGHCFNLVDIGCGPSWASSVQAGGSQCRFRSYRGPAGPRSGGSRPRSSALVARRPNQPSSRLVADTFGGVGCSPATCMLYRTHKFPNWWGWVRGVPATARGWRETATNPSRLWSWSTAATSSTSMPCAGRRALPLLRTPPVPNLSDTGGGLQGARASCRQECVEPPAKRLRGLHLTWNVCFQPSGARTGQPHWTRVFAIMEACRVLPCFRLGRTILNRPGTGREAP